MFASGGSREMRFASRVLLSLAIGASAPLRAASISDETTINNTAPTPQSPRSGSISNSINASFDLSENWSLLTGALITLEGSTPAPPGSAFDNRGGLVTTFSGGTEYHPGDSWTFGLLADFSPKSTQRSGTQLNITSATGVDSSANALLSATTSSSDFQLSAAYDSAGDSSLEWSLIGDITFTHFDTDQRIVALQEANGTTTTTAAILRYCQTHICSKALLDVIGPKPTATLNSTRLSLGGTLTLMQDTDLTLYGDYYVYAQDPTDVGFFSVGSTGRTQIAGGAGVPIAPLRYVLQPELTERMGDFSVRVWLRGGRYVDGAAQTTRGLGLKLQYKMTKALRMWATASWQRDVDSESNVSVSKTFALGVGYRF